MSNVIKAYSIRLEEDKKTIDTHLRIDKELENKRMIKRQVIEPQTEDAFVEGLQAIVMDPLPAQEAEKTAQELLEEARQEAKRIIEEAKESAELLKNDTIKAAQKKGYDEGILQSKQELQRLKTEYEEKSKRLQEEYDAMFTSFEPQMVELIASLVEKITGIVIEDKNEVILYLLEKAIRNMDKEDEYTIRVSTEDYEYVSLQKDVLISKVGREVSLYITEDTNLKKNQCLIETALKVVNCSLDVQLNNLIMDLRLLAGI